MRRLQHIAVLKIPNYLIASRKSPICFRKRSLEAKAKLPGPDVQVVTPEERRRLLEALPQRVCLVARFLYATGARVSEALEVRRDQVTIDGERARVRLVKTKGDKDRYVRIPQLLL